MKFSIISQLCMLGLVSAVVNVPIRKIGHNYGINFTIDGELYFNVIDTGIGDFITYNHTKLDPNGTIFDYCAYLTVDSTEIDFFGVNCHKMNSSVNLGGGVGATNVSITFTDSIYVENPILHAWENTTGDMGLAYCYSTSSCSSTPFQQVLSEGTGLSASNLTFGLDFRDVNSSISSIASSESSMQLGGISPEFSNNISWSQLPTPQTAFYHQFLLHDLTFCDSLLLANISRTYPVLIDTGSSCLTLPSEVYRHFIGWFDNSTILAEADSLPAFSFRMSMLNGAVSDELFIPLATLLVDPSAIRTEKGAPIVTLMDPLTSVPKEQRICVLEGDAIGHPFSSPAPSIVFGALTLQSLYFAADYSSYSMGLSNKLSQNETLYYRNARQHCAAPAVCVGSQTYSPSNNLCKPPRCDQYFFTELDDSGQFCISASTPYYFGLIFLGIIVGLEIVSFFVGQYSGFLLLHGVTGSQTSSHPNSSHYDRLRSSGGRGRVVMMSGNLLEAEKKPLYSWTLPEASQYRVGYLTLYVGKFCSQLLDVLFQFTLPPPPPPNPPQPPAAAPLTPPLPPLTALGALSSAGNEHGSSGQLRQRGMSDEEEGS